MGRKKKIINKTNVPQYAVERFARCVFDDIRAAYAKPEVRAEFQLWLAEREATVEFFGIFLFTNRDNLGIIS